jgi:hypothetical protein
MMARTNIIILSVTLLAVSAMTLWTPEEAYGRGFLRNLFRRVDIVYDGFNKVVRAVKKPVRRFRIGRFKIGRRILCPIIDRQAGRLLAGQVQSILRIKKKYDRVDKIKQQIDQFNDMRRSLRSRAKELKDWANYTEKNIRKIVSEQAKQGTITDRDAVRTMAKARDVKHAIIELSTHLGIEADRMRLDRFAERVAESVLKHSAGRIRKKLIPISRELASKMVLEGIQNRIIFEALGQVPAEQRDKLNKLLKLRGSKLKINGGPDALKRAIRRGQMKKLIRIEYGDERHIPKNISLSNLLDKLLKQTAKEIVKDIKRTVPIDIAKDELRDLLISHAPKQRDRIIAAMAKLPDSEETADGLERLKDLARQFKKLKKTDGKKMLEELLKVLAESGSLDEAIDAALEIQITPKPEKKTRTTQTPKAEPIDCAKLRDKYDKIWKENNGNASWLNCKKKSYSGCAVDVVKCYYPLQPGFIFKDKYCNRPGYVACMTGPYESYISCVEGCNAAWRNSRQPRDKCAKKCSSAGEAARDKCQGKK